jgi:hypothetical protein
MKKFPPHLTPENKKDFQEYLHQKCMSRLRNLICNHLYQNGGGGFDVYQMESSKYPELYKDRKIKQRLLDDISKELHSLGWKTKMIYGDSCLFIYTDDSELPLNALDGELL